MTGLLQARNLSKSQDSDPVTIKEKMMEDLQDKMREDLQDVGKTPTEKQIFTIQL